MIALYIYIRTCSRSMSVEGMVRSPQTKSDPQLSRTFRHAVCTLSQNFTRSSGKRGFALPVPLFGPYILHTVNSPPGCVGVERVAIVT